MFDWFLNTSLHNNYVLIKISKPKADIFAAFWNHAYNESVISGTLPSVFDKLTSNNSIKRTKKSSYKQYMPPSSLPKYFESIFLYFQWSFRKGQNTQGCLLAMVGSCKMILDQEKNMIRCLLNLSKLFLQLAPF